MKPTLIFLLAYVWSNVATPQNRFPVLVDIQFDKLLIVGACLLVFLKNRPRFTPNLLFVLVCIFVLWMYMCAWFSPYKYVKIGFKWQDEYWKFFVFYLVLRATLTDFKDIRIFMIGLSIIVLLWEMHTWNDFLHGGAYVYQQGMKRIAGVWADAGYGAGNAFGAEALFAIPFAHFGIMWARKLKWKAVFAFAMFLCCMSIVYSGTRGAMIAGLLYVFMCMRSMKRLVLSVVTASVVVLLLYFTLPPDLHYRYFGFLSAEEQEEVGEDVAALQSGSATSRIRGLVDGWRIMMRFPVAGVGPGGSQFARNMVNEKITEQSNIQLHNLYGQVMAETGIPGTLLFAVIAGTCFFLVPTATGETGLGTRFCKLALGAWLVYGMAGHTLYDLKWVILYALFDACSGVARSAPAESLPAASPQVTGGG